MYERPERGLRRLLIGNDVDSLRPPSTFTELQCDKYRLLKLRRRLPPMNRLATTMLSENSRVLLASSHSSHDPVLPAIYSAVTVGAAVSAEAVASV